MYNIHGTNAEYARRILNRNHHAVSHKVIVHKVHLRHALQSAICQQLIQTSSESKASSTSYESEAAAVPARLIMMVTSFAARSSRRLFVVLVHSLPHTDQLRSVAQLET